MPALKFDRWLNTDGNKPLEMDGSVILYRWWTSGCPFCETSLPAIEQLRKKYDDKGLKMVAVYHPKPPRAVSDEAVLNAAKAIGYSGAIAVDLDWSQLKKAYLSKGERGWTSISILVDREGVIRFVHPGPDLFPSTDKERARQDEDFRLLEKAIEALIAEDR
jgi:thiol-disulfide isomerase/thioredoxin